MKRAALYARVSTKQHGQDPMTQLMPLREYAAARGFEVEDEYVDVGWSGSKQKRPQLDRLMADARKRKFDAILVFRFDRFARSVRHLLTALGEFQTLDMDFVSLNENIDTSTPMGRMVFTIIAAVAELERELIRERVQAGVDRARKQGKKLGRPTRLVDIEKVRDLIASGRSIKSVAEQMGVSRPKIDAILKGCAEKSIVSGAEIPSRAVDATA